MASGGGRGTVRTLSADPIEAVGRETSKLPPLYGHPPDTCGVIHWETSETPLSCFHDLVLAFLLPLLLIGPLVVGVQVGNEPLHLIHSSSMAIDVSPSVVNMICFILVVLVVFFSIMCCAVLCCRALCASRMCKSYVLCPVSRADVHNYPLPQNNLQSNRGFSGRK